MPLTISVRFLTGYCVAARSKTDPQPEWPPHPARLFMALAAAYFESDRDDAERKALEWLEALDAPSLVVPANATPNRAIGTFVPTNFTHDKIDDAELRKWKPIQTIPSLRRKYADRRFARTHLPDDDTLRYVFTDVQSADVARHEPALQSLCSRVGRLGHSTSFVQLSVDQDVPVEITLKPTDSGSQRLRTTGRGTLNRLAEMFEQPPHRPIITRNAGYERVKPGPAKTKPIHSVFEPKLEIFRLEPDDSRFRHLDLTTTLRLTRQLHEAMLKNAGELGPVPEVISGHQPDGSPSERPHLAYLPIPFVGGDFGDGHLLGFAVAVPRDLDAPDKRALIHGLRQLVNNGLTLGELGRWNVGEDVELRARGANMLADTWTAHPDGCATWASVTPLAFDKHPRDASKAGYLEEAAELVAAMFERVFLPRPRVRVTPVSPFTGVPTAREFPRVIRKRDGKADGERRHTHVIVEFDQPVIGPVLVGAGRYRGYGLLRPWREGGRK